MKTQMVRLPGHQIGSGIVALGWLILAGFRAYRANGDIFSWVLAAVMILLAAFYAQKARTGRFSELKFTEEAGLQFKTHRKGSPWSVATEVEEYGSEFLIGGEREHVVVKKRYLNGEFREILTSLTRPNRPSQATLACASR